MEEEIGENERKWKMKAKENVKERRGKEIEEKKMLEGENSKGKKVSLLGNGGKRGKMEGARV